MKNLLYIFLIKVAFATITFGQDGSNILYIKNSQLDSSFIGDFIHIDFYNRSFHGRTLDTINIAIDHNPVKFLEHRKDTGFNNWFGEQYLESVAESDGFILRVSKFRLDKITSDSVFVTTYLTYYKDEKLVTEKSKQVVNEFSRNIIIEILVSAASHKER